MVASARLAAGLSGLRNRNTRVTNKTQLHVVKGSIEADPIILDDEDDEKNRILASQGVDEEDANEHHLQAALFASSQRTLSTTHHKNANSNNDPNAFIPTPDAAGLVAEYDTLYPPGHFKETATHLRFSDSLDESLVGGLNGGFTYLLDERDAEWLERNNGAARGEGTSASAGANGATGSNGVNGSSSISRGAPRAPYARSAKAKGKEPEQLSPNVTQPPSMVINENNFELVMGLFEKWTDEVVSPYLHLAHDPEHFPEFTDYERFFSVPLTPAIFANFTTPPDLPSPDEMIQLARVIYPWWRERRIEREGHRVVPQLNVLIIEAQEKEDKTGGSPYICFRKRDVKPMRKTRTNNVTHIEKLTRLRGELQASLELSKMALQREKLKSDVASASESVWRSRESLAEGMKQLNIVTPGSVPPGDESLLFDKEQKPRKKVEISASGRIILTNRRLSQARAGLSESSDPHSALSLNGDTSHLFELRQRDPSDRVVAIQREVDRELVKARRDDVYWEDLIDIPQALPPPSGVERYFKPALPPALENATPSSASSSTSTSGMSSHSRRMSRSVRLRVGRGGRLHFDRRLHPSQQNRLLQRERAGYPLRSDDHLASQEKTERWASRSWRPRHETSNDPSHSRREPQAGEHYLGHPSIYDHHEGLMGDVDQPRNEVHDSIIGFEQSGLGWDGIGPRGPWVHASADRDAENLKATTPLSLAEADNLGIDARDHLVEAWSGRNADDDNGGGGALAFFTDGDVTENDSRQDKTSQDPEDEQDFSDVDGRHFEVTERAWRVEDRWRYDHESGQREQDREDRFLLDDFQPKFMRTAITLLDALDHDAISTDPQSLAPPPLKHNRYLDHQLRLQNPGLPQPSTSSSTPITMQKSLPLRQMPPPSNPAASQAPALNGTSVHAGAYAQLSLSPVSNSTPVVNGNGSLNSAHPLPSPKPPNGTSTPGLVPSGARLPDSTGATIRVSTPIRTKHSPPHALPPSSGVNPMMPLANGDTASNGAFQPHATSSYPSLKTVPGRVLGSQQDLQQQGRVLQKPVSNGANGDTASVNLALGVNNLPLKLPPQRAAQLRARANGENHGTNPASETPGTDHYSRTQQLALPSLPSNGTHPT